MNWVAIGLAILVILLFYILYTFFLMKSTELTTTASLSSSNPPIDITRPNGLRYAYGIWIYVNSWDSNTDKTIFKRDSSIKLFFDSLKPELQCELYVNQDNVSVTITDNFPLQKWVHVVISVDGQYLDAYLDGKLVKSSKMHVDGASPTVGSKDDKMLLGGTTTYDAQVSKFTHWTEPLDPQTVWSVYNKGNGQGSGLTNSMSSYGVDFTILKDDVEQTKYRLF
jgi:hypothetical protein